MAIVIAQEFCTGCGVCLETCRIGAITIIECKATIDQQRCRKCGICIRACPAGAIKDVVSWSPKTPPTQTLVVQNNGQQQRHNVVSAKGEQNNLDVTLATSACNEGMFQQRRRRRGNHRGVGRPQQRRRRLRRCWESSQQILPSDEQR